MTISLPSAEPLVTVSKFLPRWMVARVGHTHAKYPSTDLWHLGHGGVHGL